MTLVSFKKALLAVAILAGFTSVGQAAPGDYEEMKKMYSQVLEDFGYAANSIEPLQARLEIVVSYSNVLPKENAQLAHNILTDIKELLNTPAGNLCIKGGLELGDKCRLVRYNYKNHLLRLDNAILNR
ncbi:hypothetical protein QJS83_12035 [Bdellovibrio sp. 22V]|uniref:hypothetical protein n=1 Tax=Bdellovibrio TaxID=958 RepID=UPI0025436D21|nr:hypothetical protein [Bdellovibrio sp. 22V]WII71190.1 hypothetical protein QJS83_12035 [Bdellovibrio sp. 22V]